jgi:hypothetical protein
LKKLIALFLISTLTLSATSAVAATATPKPSAKPTAKATAKATTKATAKATAKATKKPATKKKKVVKKKKKKRAPKKVIPSPAAIWPPKGFTQNGEVFAKIPTAAELQGEASNNFNSAKVFLRADLRKCDEFACGAVTVASDAGCTWWEVNSTFEQIDLKTGKILKTLGTLRTVSQGTKAQVLQSIMLISEIKHKDADGKVLNNIKASGIAVSCHHDAAPDLSNRNFFTTN